MQPSFSASPSVQAPYLPYLPAPLGANSITSPLHAPFTHATLAPRDLSSAFQSSASPLLPPGLPSPHVAPPILEDPDMDWFNNACEVQIPTPISGVSLGTAYETRGSLQQDMASARAEGLAFAAVQIPLLLSQPVLHSLTNPHVDLGKHLRRFGMLHEAQEFTRSSMPCDFLLTTFLTMNTQLETTPTREMVSAEGEKIMHYLEAGVDQHQAEIERQLMVLVSKVKPPAGRTMVPRCLHLPWLYKAYTCNPTSSLCPTHFLAVCPSHGPSSMTVPTPFGTATLVNAPCTLVPLHWIVYVLQCAHLPMPHAPTMAGDVPVLVLAVPFPEHWFILHRWLYTQDRTKLLAALLPFGNLHTLRDAIANGTLVTADVLEAMACLSIPTLMRIVLKILATWHNGKCVGIFADTFWATLRHAWEVGVSAIVLRKARMVPNIQQVHSA
ncbi:hypothetical protein MVES1_003267 [Malassezia vespertilionis]|uniref:uncharacterized protein n=1 Tax=Malassezia vespertilionis TaxID=2020962 RepID=UPI0024B0C16C|nr:uncharacterized protein MVES1_003267 [Malassezia vespertilionis]WFD07899.1 hypothetical protein MVES1_003267 [Malassezia vespertilionis]